MFLFCVYVWRWDGVEVAGIVRVDLILAGVAFMELFSTSIEYGEVQSQGLRKASRNNPLVKRNRTRILDLYPFACPCGLNVLYIYSSSMYALP